MSTLFELDAENVVVKGFTFDNVRINNYIDGGATGTLTNQFGGVDISNNIFTKCEWYRALSARWTKRAG